MNGKWSGPRSVRPLIRTERVSILFALANALLMSFVKTLACKPKSDLFAITMACSSEETRMIG